MAYNDSPRNQNENDFSFSKMILKSKEEIDEICDSGMFNSIIEGYILLAFDSLGKSCDVTSFSYLFDQYSAKDARNRYAK